MNAPHALNPIARADRLDALRGAAVVWMAAFHFCFDLSYFKLIDTNFYQDPLWTVQRAAIVSLFLFCAGMGQTLSVRAELSWPRFWRRWCQVAGCALLVSLGSWLMFPKSFISFGILHAMALMMPMTRWISLRGWPVWFVVTMGLVCLLMPRFVESPVFDSRWTNWVGLVTRLPRTEDYVPLLPWWGVMLWGSAAGRWLIRRRSEWLWSPVRSVWGRGLATLGRWSLSFYLLHQPILLGLLTGVVTLLPH